MNYEAACVGFTEALTMMIDDPREKLTREDVINLARYYDLIKPLPPICDVDPTQCGCMFSCHESRHPRFTMKNPQTVNPSLIRLPPKSVAIVASRTDWLLIGGAIAGLCLILNFLFG